jgi:hypothetical protein
MPIGVFAILVIYAECLLDKNNLADRHFIDTVQKRLVNWLTVLFVNPINLTWFQPNVCRLSDKFSYQTMYQQNVCRQKGFGPKDIESTTFSVFLLKLTFKHCVNFPLFPKPNSHWPIGQNHPLDGSLNFRQKSRDNFFYKKLRLFEDTSDTI